MSEIPGFKKVGVKQRKRTKNSKSENISLKRLNVSPKKYCEDPEVVPKCRNSLKFIINQELGMTAGIQAKKEFYEMKISHKEKSPTSNLSIPSSHDSSCEVNFLKGDILSLFGVWRVSSDSKEDKNVMGIISHRVNEEGYAPQTYKPCGNIVDICRGYIDYITVCSYPPGHFPSYLNILNVRVPVTETFCPPPWNCCCYLKQHDFAVIGGDGYIIYVSLGGDRPASRVNYPTKVCTLSRHPMSRVFLTGLQTGHILMNDYRTAKAAYSIQISDKAVNDSVFVNDEEIIVTDVEGKLVKVDLRTRKISAMFIGHKHSVTKRPFSVEENMLCANGADNVVRIWHISGGLPIHVIRSTSGHEARGWLWKGINTLYLNYFEGNTRTVFTI